MARHEVVVDVVERARHRHVRRTRRHVDRQRRRGNVAGTSFQHLEQRRVLRRDDHLDVQIMALRELAQELELEAHLLAAPHEEGRRVVPGDDAQHAVALHLGKVAVSLPVRQGRGMLDREESIELLEQPRRVRTDRPRHHVAHQRPGEETQRGPLQLELRAACDIDRRHVQPAVRDACQQPLRRHVLRYETDLDFRVGAACFLYRVPERRALPNGDLPSREVTQRVHPIALAHHDMLAGAVSGNGEGDLLPALLGDGDVGGNEVPAARDQRGNELVPALHLQPVDLEKVLLGEATHEIPVEPGRVEGAARTDVTNLRLPARNDDGEGPPGCDQLQRRAQEPLRRFRLCARFRRTV